MATDRERAESGQEGSDRPDGQLPWRHQQILKPLVLGLAFLHVAAKPSMVSWLTGATVSGGAMTALQMVSGFAMAALIPVAFVGCWVHGAASIRWLRARSARRI